MNSKERIALIRNIRKEKRKLRKLKGKAKRIEQLKNNPDVKLYLQLSQELKANLGDMDIKLIDDETILKEFAQKMRECDCKEQYLIRRGIVKPNKYSRIFCLNDEYGDTYYYTCLDCRKDFLIPKKDKEKFEQDKRVIMAEGMNIYDFYQARARYIELLMNYESPQAYLILKNEIEGRKRVRS